MNTLRRTFVACAIALSAWPRISIGQRVWRIGYLSGQAAPADGKPSADLQAAMKELGYVDGTNLIWIGRWAAAVNERLPDLAKELVAAKVDIILAAGGPAAAAAKAASAATPVVAFNAGDVVKTGLVPRLDRPGGNVTGMNDQATELSAKRLELVKTLVPKANRVAVLWNADDPAMTLRRDEVERVSRSMQIRIVPLGVRSLAEVDQAFNSMAREPPDALLLLTDGLTSTHQKHIISFATERRIPTVYEFAGFVRNGGLLSYGTNFKELWRRVAGYVDRILKGAKPGDLPIEQPTRFELIVSNKSARAMGITLPQSVLMVADEVIE